jgi:cytochrome c peroxidase
MLFFEPRLSAGGDLSCNTCHDLKTWGVDRARVSTGHRGLQGARNAPTVYNAAGHVAQFWDGRAADVEEQAKGPVLNPIEMAMPSAQAVTSVLQSIPEYREAFRRAFPGASTPVTFENMARAIGAFERTLATPARWDSYLRGDASALDSAERAGFAVFMRAGCVHCHMGPLVGGTAFAELGLAQPWPDQSDLGRFAVTGAERDRFVFKVPSLRNVSKTAPYFHDGRTEALEDAVRKMGVYQLGIDLPVREVALIVSWLATLTGKLPHEVSPPPLPPEVP